MVLTAVMFGWKWAVYSPENYPAGEFYISLIEAYLAKSISKSEEGATDAEMEKAKKIYVARTFLCCRLG